MQCHKLVCPSASAIMKEDIHEKESSIVMVNINLIRFSSNHSAVIAKLQTSSKPSKIIVPYNIDTGCDGNIMPLNLLKKIFLNTAADSLAATKDTTTLKAYHSTKITPLGRCCVLIENINKCKKCIFL